jgi:maleylacetate reductase
VARAIGAEDAGRGLYELSGRLGIPRSLREIGMPADGIERAVALITEKPYWNPRIVDPVSLCGLLQRAFNGEPPIAE